MTAALAAAVCYGMGSVLQGAAAAAAVPTAGVIDVAGLARLLTRWRYLGGFALDACGFLAVIVALRSLPLFVVEASVAASVGVTALGAHRFLGVRLVRTERVALAVLAAGLVLLGVAGRPEHARSLTGPGPALLLGSVVVSAVAAAAVLRSRAPWASTAAAAISGASFGAVGIAARAFQATAMWSHALSDPLAYAAAAHGGLGILLYATALQRGRVTTVAAVSLSVQAVVPSAVGLMFLGDHARSGFLPVAALGFAITVGATIVLARHASPAALQPAAPSR